DQLKVQKITLDQARAAMIAAEENYKIQLSQSESEIAACEITLTLAEIDLKKYLEADYVQNLKEVEGQIKLAKADVQIQDEPTARPRSRSSSRSRTSTRTSRSRSASASSPRRRTAWWSTSSASRAASAPAASNRSSPRASRSRRARS